MISSAIVNRGHTGKRLKNRQQPTPKPLVSPKSSFAADMSASSRFSLPSSNTSALNSTLAQAWYAELQSYALLYQALGGGWE